MNWFRGDPVEMSWFAMPEWPGLSTSLPEPIARGRMETVELSVEPMPGDDGEEPEPIALEAQVWLPRTTTTATPGIRWLYARTAALEAGDWPQTLDAVVGRTVEPLLVVFVDPPRGRATEGSFATQIVPQIDALFRTRPDREARAVVGMGWGGLAAAVTAFTPRRRRRRGRRAEPVPGRRTADGAADQRHRRSRTPPPWRCGSISNGGKWDLTSPHEEMNQRKFSRWGWDLFTEKGWEPIGGEVWDSTDFASWANRTDVLLEALFPLEDAGAKLARWRTGSP